MIRVKLEFLDGSNGRTEINLLHRVLVAQSAEKSVTRVFLLIREDSDGYVYRETEVAWALIERGWRDKN